jgi:hypothetical protein
MTLAKSQEKELTAAQTAIGASPWMMMTTASHPAANAGKGKTLLTKLVKASAKRIMGFV